MAKYKSEVGKILSAAAGKAKERLKESKEPKILKKPKTESTLGRRGHASGRRSEDIVSDVARSERIRAKLGSRKPKPGTEIRGRVVQTSGRGKKKSVSKVEGDLREDAKTERIRRDRKIYEDTKKKLKKFKKSGQPDERSGVERRGSLRPQYEPKIKKKKKPQESQSPHGEVENMSPSEYRKLTGKKKGFE